MISRCSVEWTVYKTVSGVSVYSDLNKLVKWSEEWQMLFNIGKCKVVHFGRKNPS